MLEDNWAPWQGWFETGVGLDIGVPGSALQLVVGGSLQLHCLAPPSLLGDDLLLVLGSRPVGALV